MSSVAETVGQLCDFQSIRNAEGKIIYERLLPDCERHQVIQNSAPSSSSTGARISCNEANLVGVIEVAGAWFNVVFDGGHDTSQDHLDEAAPRCSPHCQLLSEVYHFAFRHNVGHFYLPLGHLVYRREEVVVRVVVECSSESLSA